MKYMDCAEKEIAEIKHGLTERLLSMKIISMKQYCIFVLIGLNNMTKNDRLHHMIQIKKQEIKTK